MPDETAMITPPPLFCDVLQRFTRTGVQCSLLNVESGQGQGRALAFDTHGVDDGHMQVDVRHSI